VVERVRQVLWVQAGVAAGGHADAKVEELVIEFPPNSGFMQACDLGHENFSDVRILVLKLQDLPVVHRPVEILSIGQAQAWFLTSTSSSDCAPASEGFKILAYTACPTTAGLLASTFLLPHPPACPTTAGLLASTFLLPHPPACPTTAGLLASTFLLASPSCLPIYKPGLTPPTWILFHFADERQLLGAVNVNHQGQVGVQGGAVRGRPAHVEGAGPPARCRRSTPIGWWSSSAGRPRNGPMSLSLNLQSSEAEMSHSLGVQQAGGDATQLCSAQIWLATAQVVAVSSMCQQTLAELTQPGVQAAGELLAKGRFAEHEAGQVADSEKLTVTTVSERNEVDRVGQDQRVARLGLSVKHADFDLGRARHWRTPETHLDATHPSREALEGEAQQSRLRCPTSSCACLNSSDWPAPDSQPAERLASSRPRVSSKTSGKRNLTKQKTRPTSERAGENLELRATADRREKAKQSCPFWPPSRLAGPTRTGKLARFDPTGAPAGSLWGIKFVQICQETQAFNAFNAPQRHPLSQRASPVSRFNEAIQCFTRFLWCKTVKFSAGGRSSRTSRRRLQATEVELGPRAVPSLTLAWLQGQGKMRIKKRKGPTELKCRAAPPAPQGRLEQCGWQSWVMEKEERKEAGRRQTPRISTGRLNEAGFLGRGRAEIGGDGGREEAPARRCRLGPDRISGEISERAGNRSGSWGGDDRLREGRFFPQPGRAAACQRAALSRWQGRYALEKDLPSGVQIPPRDPAGHFPAPPCGLAGRLEVASRRGGGRGLKCLLGGAAECRSSSAMRGCHGWRAIHRKWNILNRESRLGEKDGDGESGADEALPGSEAGGDGNHRSRSGGRSQLRQQPPAPSAFADAAAFLQRIGAGGFDDEAEEARKGADQLDDEAAGGWKQQQRRPRRQRRPSESLGRRLRNFLMRPRRRQSASDAATAMAEAESESCSELQDYVYTRWVFHRRWRGSPERSLSHDHLRSPAAAAADASTGVATSSINEAAAAMPRTAEATSALPSSSGRRLSRANGGSAMTKSASARMVRFRCPYDSSGSDQDSTLVSPYLTSAFPCLPLPPGGSVSSGYSSDRDTPPEAAAAVAAAAAASQHWVTREEDIDCLLLRRPPNAAAADPGATSSAIQVGDDDDFDLVELDVSAFFAAAPSAGPSRAARWTGGRNGEYRTLPLPPPPLPPRCHRNSHQNLPDGAQRGGAAVYYDPVADEIDRLVGEVREDAGQAQFISIIAGPASLEAAWLATSRRAELVQQVTQATHLANPVRVTPDNPGGFLAHGRA
uniref:MALT1 protein n=1 Tax=Macrostomum lignano TaxID=282301 RepID=A0A1I8IUP1_9PLAT